MASIDARAESDAGPIPGHAPRSERGHETFQAIHEKNRNAPRNAPFPSKVRFKPAPDRLAHPARLVVARVYVSSLAQSTRAICASKPLLFVPWGTPHALEFSPGLNGVPAHLIQPVESGWGVAKTSPILLKASLV